MAKKMTDPVLVGPDPLWKFLRSGKAHVYYGLAGVAVLAVLAGKPRWFAAVTCGVACGCFADLWAHQYQH